MIMLSFTAATIKLALLAILIGAVIMFMSWLKVKKTGKKGFMGFALLWIYFLMQLLIVLFIIGLVIFTIRIIFP
jgi:hypothetical protein